MPAYDPAVLAPLIGACKKKGMNNRGKGETLADVVEYVFSVVPGVDLLERSYLEHDGSGEIDFIFANDPYQSRLATSGVTVFIECKNEARAIGAAQVRVFASKLRDHNQPFGIMVSSKGLSGKARNTHGHQEVAQELSHGRTIVVVTLDELSSLLNTDQLVALVKSRWQELEVKRRYTSI